MRAYWDVVEYFAADWKRFYNHPAELTLSDLNRFPDTHPVPDADVVLDVRAAVGKLTGQNRDVIDCVSLGGESIAAYAARNRLTNAAVRVRIHRAREALREILADYTK